MYIAYNCKNCKTIFIIPTEDLHRMEKGNRVLACPFGHRDIEVVDKYGDLIECMKQRSSTLT